MADEAPKTEEPGLMPTDRPDEHPLLPLVVRGLSFGINGRRIIRDVSFWIGSSGRTVILGPNGAGKSVMLRLCHGLLRPTSGEIRWGDLSVSQAREQQAMASQHPVLLRRTVRGNLLHVLSVKRVPRNEREHLVDAALEQAGLAGLGARAAGAAGTKILMTTHDIAQARRLAADVMFLNDGRLLEHAPAAEFFAAPKDPVAASFLAGELPA
jgi:tungstate transport system ATP-binding protein